MAALDGLSFSGFVDTSIRSSNSPARCNEAQIIYAKNGSADFSRPGFAFVETLGLPRQEGDRMLRFCGCLDADHSMVFFAQEK